MARGGDRPKVTVVIIFLNGERFLAEAIESVLAQTFTDWELILVDDGSTDGATAIATGYAEREPGHIRYTEHEGHGNRGMSASRNAGLALARGEYVAFLDADDVWLPRRLEAHVRALDARPEVAMTMGPALFWFSWEMEESVPAGRAMAGDTLRPLKLPEDEPLHPYAVVTSFLESSGSTVPWMGSITVRRDAARRVRGFEDSFRTLYEDQAFYFRMALRYPVLVIGEPLGLYRQHAESACASEGGMRGDRRTRPVFLTWLQDQLIDEGVKDERLWRAHRKEMLRFDRPKLHFVMHARPNLRDAWNGWSRRMVIRILTPKVYTSLRRRLGMNPVDVRTVRQDPPGR